MTKHLNILKVIYYYTFMQFNCKPAATLHEYFMCVSLSKALQLGQVNRSYDTDWGMSIQSKHQFQKFK